MRLKILVGGCKLNADYEMTVKVFKAFCDTNRLQILEMLKNGELCLCKIQENLPIQQSTLSHHIKILIESNLITARKEGKWTYYNLCDHGINTAKLLLNYFTYKESENEVMFKKAKNDESLKSVKGAPVKILGAGCSKCDELFKNTHDALLELNMNTDIEHITDLVEIVKYSVMSTPALIVDGKLLSAGQVLTKNSIIKLIKEAKEN